MPASKEYKEFLEMVRDLSTLEQVVSVLGWDEQTYMPSGGAPDRARQKAAIIGIIHERLTSKKMGSLIKALKKQELSADGQVILRETERKWQRASSMPVELVKEIAHTGSMSVEAWARARKESDFKIMAPWLKKMIDLKVKEAEHVGYEDRPYDALLDEYEPCMRSAELDGLFSRLKAKLVPVVDKVLNAPEPKCAMPSVRYPWDVQRRFITNLCLGIGYDLNCGRIDISAHPFTTGSARDVRITVKYEEENPVYAIFPAIHETGHALYEQGFREKYYGTPLAESVSLGIHESQSRLWENIVGRSLPFWTFYYPQMQLTFPGMKRLSLKAFHRGINKVRPSHIRVDADELTYNLHVMLRYEIESAIFEGRLKAGEIPEFWNDRFEQYLGIEVPDDARGCLQDVHWAWGSFGYFPTYALGNLYAAQLWNTARRKIPGLEDRIASGDTRTLLDWLRANVHRHGKRYCASDLIENATGEKPSEDHFIRYAKEKYGEIYGISL
ncbi:carboxypeptidase M32 [Methanocella arvoryzae]|uniref:Metal-dependent carboxypeptidase n=1 Tax=Methanocella arvoryzae (strain DSM 22066 / NBRC 105507 / MRE50) TaxID=351160 RepID=Q0W6N4_METAR|nr:carboxypeptidase M32 [Methanocella arvoryzae]CAJ35959.1 putative Zn-dependend thermostable carboxypeptidase (M32 family) [Methanocella arvoryzae MRE50]